MKKHTKTAAQYRWLAEEIRTTADEKKNADSRTTLLRLAQDYEKVADSLERRAAPDRSSPRTGASA